MLILFEAGKGSLYCNRTILVFGYCCILIGVNPAIAGYCNFVFPRRILCRFALRRIQVSHSIII